MGITVKGQHEKDIQDDRRVLYLDCPGDYLNEWTATSASPRKSLACKSQSYFRPAESETLRVGPRSW